MPPPPKKKVFWSWSPEKTDQIRWFSKDKILCWGRTCALECQQMHNNTLWSSREITAQYIHADFHQKKPITEKQKPENISHRNTKYQTVPTTRHYRLLEIYRCSTSIYAFVIGMCMPFKINYFTPVPVTFTELALDISTCHLFTLEIHAIFIPLVFGVFFLHLRSLFLTNTRKYHDIFSR